MNRLKITATIMATTALMLAVYCIYKEFQYEKYSSESAIESVTKPNDSLPGDTLPVIPNKH
ncbi:MAG: hypothetical protein CVU09_12775 [Bacteroidetes bacterium HGW-Bacteroidetes-4]|nr:MAG: hypothetical protein CVU09_12775 [Bacteroidetes bacterium HGW-Bacteroidetes-4]